MCVGGGGEGGRQSSLEDDMEGNVPEGVCVGVGGRHLFFDSKAFLIDW